MNLLHWAPAEREHGRALRDFRCTSKGKRVRRHGQWELEHPAKHELRVQALICHHLAPVGDPCRTVLLGWDEDSALGAVSTYRNLTSGAFAIDVIAVAERFRRRGGPWAKEALVTTLDFITADAHSDGYDVARVSADIHEDNRPSQRLFESERFEVTLVREDGYQVWAADLFVGGAIFDEGA